MPPPLFTFEGLGNIDGVLPPDVNGDVGLQHYVEMVNLHFRVFDKRTGAPLTAPTLMSDLFAAAGFPAPASTIDDGDPIVLYDHLADRWLISQFIVSITPPHEVIGISQTGDPTGAWYLYDFVMPNSKMNDYPHFGVWPDGYYMSDNQFESFSWGGAGVFAFDRAAMLAGDSGATYQYFDLYGANPDFGGLLPSDLDGAPPPPGTPNYFMMMDDSFLNPFDALYIWEFHVDWQNPNNSTFGLGGQPDYTIPVTGFDSFFSGGRNNIPQPDTAQRLDAIADRLMHRVQYRNFGSHESLVGCHTVDTDGTDHAGVRYYELRRPLPGGTFAVHERATFAPDSDHRWMGSAAMDGRGNLAVGYSVSGPSTYPSIRYAGRLADDPPNGLHLGEAELFAGTGSQTHSAARWGDYTMLSVDPTDDATFWYVSEYLTTTSSADWHTRIGSFRLADPIVGELRGFVTNAAMGAAISMARVTRTSGFPGTLTAADGTYTLLLSTGMHSVVASAPGFYPSEAAAVQILEGATTRQDFALAAIPLRVRPEDDFVASGLEGGPFSPDYKPYTLTNALPDALSWVAARDVDWLAVTPAAGDLWGNGSTGITVELTHEANFLSAGTYEATILFSNVTEGGIDTRSVVLTVTPYLGEPVMCTDFEGGLPAGWTILTNATQDPLASWVFNDPGSRGNLTGGDGDFAIVDSDEAGTIDVDTELRTAGADFSGADSVVLVFKTDFFQFEDEFADVDVSSAGAAGPWLNVWRKTGSNLRGPTTVTVDISDAAAGSPDAMVRFRYHNANWEWWWQVDDVCIYTRNLEAGNLGVQPRSGLVASGFHGGPFAPERVYRLTNAGRGSIAWTSACDAAWMDITPREGGLPGFVTVDVGVRAGAAAELLAPGAYAAFIVFSNRTQGLGFTRSVNLTVVEPLTVAPHNVFESAGLEGGPFSPSNQVYELSNPSSHPVAWTARSDRAWITIHPRDGLLAPDAEDQVTVGSDAGLLAPGLHTGAVWFSNTVSAAVISRDVSLNVIEITGEIEISDTVSPTNDQYVPFGVVAPQAPRTESITVANTHAERNLTVSEVRFGYYQEDFNDGLAQGWIEDVDANWNVIDGEYRAAAEVPDFMTAVYAERAWDDVSAEITMYRRGDEDWSEGLTLRASQDFDADGTGSGYLFLLSYGSYAVFWVDGASVEVLQGWTASPSIDLATNSVLASCEGEQLRLFVNGTLLWEGVSSLSETGRVGVVGYTDPSSATTHFFDDVVLGPPVQGGLELGGKQRYLNSLAQSGSRIERANHKAVKPPHVDPGGDEPDAGLQTTADDRVLGPFSMTNLPALPVSLVPGESFTFSVTYTPEAVGSNRTAIIILSNDNDEPQANVVLDGRAAAARVTGRVTAAHSGDPIQRASVTAAGGSGDRVAYTDVAGDYTLDLVVGTYDLSASARYFETQTVTDISLPLDGMIVTQDFVLAGSQLYYQPPSLSNVVLLGDVVTNVVRLTNSGPLDVFYRLQLQGCAEPVSPIHLPPYDDAMPRGTNLPSAARAPVRTAGPNPDVPGLAAAISPAPCYGVNMIEGELVSFMTDAPETLTIITDTANIFIPSVDFLGGDLTVLYGLNYDDLQLLSFNTVDGTKAVVGSAVPLSGQSWTGLAGDPVSGVLYASSTDIASSHLYAINPATGEATWIASIQNAAAIIDIAINAQGEMYGVDIVNDTLVAIDKVTGLSSVVGAIGFDANFAQGMDFDEQENVLYLAAFNAENGQGELRVADTETGNTALVGVFEGGAELCMAVAKGAVACDWVQLSSPDGVVPAGSTGTFAVVFDAGRVALPGDYASDIKIAGSFVNTVPDMPLAMHVSPDDLSVLPVDDLLTEGPWGGPFAPPRTVYMLVNDGAVDIEWQGNAEATWLTVSPTGGVLAAGAHVQASVSLTTNAALLAVGSYETRASFRNRNGGAVHQRFVSLRITPAEPIAIVQFDLDLDPGWTREGQWAFGQPSGGGSHNSDPSSGHTGTNVYGYNLAGDYEDDIPAYYLTTGPLDCTAQGHVELQFWRWLGVESATWDDASVEASTNGVDWSAVWTHSGYSVSDSTWQFVSYDISAVASNQPAVYLRWGMGPTDESITYPGWNIDDISLVGQNSTASSCTLNVSSEYGHADPPAGSHVFPSGVGMVCSITNTPLTAGTTQYVCSGWTGSGRLASGGSGSTTGPFTLDRDSSVAWHWRTNYWLQVDSDGPGSVDQPGGWEARGTNVTATATPGAYAHFVRWTGDRQECVIAGNRITMPMNLPRTIRAEFAYNLAPLGTPEWWLAEYGLTGDTFAAAETNDWDFDRMFTWQEYVAGTDPADALSVFQFFTSGTTSPAGYVVQWPSVSNRYYNLYRAEDLMQGTGAFKVIPGASNLPATPPTNVYTDATSNDSRSVFYRIAVREQSTNSSTTMGATLSSFTGGDAGEGIDMSGSIVYAVDVGSDATGYMIQGVLFDRDEDIGGVTVTSDHTVDNWSTNPEFGSTASDNALELLLDNIQRGDVITAAMDVTPGMQYTVQLLFSENDLAVAGQRVQDVVIESVTVLDDYDLVAEGHYSQAADPDIGGVLTYSFTAADSVLNIAVVDAPGGDPAAILNAIILTLDSATWGAGTGDAEHVGQVKRTTEFRDGCIHERHRAPSRRPRADRVSSGRRVAFSLRSRRFGPADRLSEIRGQVQPNLLRQLVHRRQGAHETLPQARHALIRAAGIPDEDLVDR